MIKRGIVDLVTASALWGTIGIVTQIGYEHNANVFQIILFRSLSSSLLVFIIFKNVKAILNRIPLIMGIVAIIFYETYVYTVNILGASLSAVFLYTAPLWVILASKVYLKDEINGRKILASILVIIGVYLIYFSKISLISIGWGMASGFTYAMLIIYSRFMQIKGYKDQEILASQAVWSLPFSLLFLMLSPKLTSSSILTGIYLGIIATFLAYIFFYRGMRLTDSITASVISSLEPVFTIVFAIIVLHQILTPLQFLGSGIIIFSSIFISI
ncbi:permease [Sulfolobus sp. S-194]|uniref:DMT family transporter n=1 Tax=Sulfolobus sp. S-194 TaxID=2512240 RepID=UPI0014372CCA|nr:EamA family transporter [Sulfolobus sp. S-194]QIW24664.1 permease [Sulfolobus sp. S-194]